MADRYDEIRECVDWWTEASRSHEDEPFDTASRMLAGHVPWLLDRIDAARKLHRPEKRWHDGSGEWSVDTPEDTDVDDPEYFEICTHCGGLEVNDQAPLVSYRDSLWPCATIRALDGVRTVAEEYTMADAARDQLDLNVALRAEIDRLQARIDAVRKLRDYYERVGRSHDPCVWCDTYLAFAYHLRRALDGALPGDPETSQ